MPEIIKGRRWMLKFQIVDEIEEEAEVRRAVLKQIHHVETDYLDYIRSKLMPDDNKPKHGLGPAMINKVILSEDDDGACPRISVIETNKAAVKIQNRFNPAKDRYRESRERHKVLTIRGNGGFSIPFKFDFPVNTQDEVGAAGQEEVEVVVPAESEAVDQGEPEGAISHRDLRFTAAIRPAIESLPISILKGNANDLGVTILLAKADIPKDPVPEDIPCISEFDCVLPVFYMEQPQGGYLLVAELITNKDEPQIRRFLLSVFISKKGGSSGKQVDIFTPRYEVEGEEDLYYIGFHQDRDSKKRKADFLSQTLDQSRESETEIDEPPPQRLEFVFGRDGNFVQFGTLDLEPDDGFDFYLTGVVPIGIGRWPVSDKETLYYHGDIEEIICDPWSECTRC